MSSPQWDLLQDDERARLGEWIGETLARVPTIPEYDWHRFSFDIARLPNGYSVAHVRLVPIKIPHNAGAGLPSEGARQPAPPGSVHMHIWEPIGDRCGPMVTHECDCGAAIYLPPVARENPPG